MTRAVDIEGRGVKVNGRSVGVGSAIPDSVVENWEDGDTTVSLKSNWSGWTVTGGSLSAQQTTVINGSWSGEYTLNETSKQEISATRNTTGTPTEVSTKFNITSRNGSDADRVEFRLENAGTVVASVGFFGGGNIKIYGVGDTGDDYATNTDYKIRVYNIDWTNEQYDHEVIRLSDSTTISSGTDNSFANSTSSADELKCWIDNDSDGGGFTCISDDWEWM